MTLDTNVRPYFDDYSEDKQFYQILYKPSVAVQARELNQMQTILQKQIERHGKHIFKEGSMVIPGQVSIDKDFFYVKLQPEFNGVPVTDFIDSLIDSEVELTGQNSGVRAKAVFYTQATEQDPLTLYVKYVSSGTDADPEIDGTIKTFVQDELIFSDQTVPNGVQVLNEEGAVGIGSAANIQRGVYFVQGRFVLVREQTIILDKYTNTPSYRVGLQIVEEFIEASEDLSLLDNAQGSTNFAAPGADRYFIDLVLDKKELADNTTKDFVELIKTSQGVIEFKVDRTDYSVLEETLARRTYDESGNYTVNPFNIQLKDHRNNDQGDWKANTPYIKGDVVRASGRFYVAQNSGLSGLVAPNHVIGAVGNGGVLFLQEDNPVFNNGFLANGDTNKFAVGVEPGKAYVFGYEIENIATRYIPVDKARSFEAERNGTVPTTIGSFVLVTNLVGAIDTTNFPQVQIRDLSGTQTGTARIRYVEYQSGTLDSNGTYFVSLFDVKMNSGKKFEQNAASLFFDNVSGADFTASILFDTKVLTGSLSTTAASAVVDGNGTLFTEELEIGDNVRIGSQTFVVLSIASDTQFTATANATATVSNVSATKRIYKLNESTNQSLLFRVPNGTPRKLRDIDNETISNAVYHTRQRFTAVAAGGVINISVAFANETFASAQQPDSFLVIDTVSGQVIAPSVVLSIDATSATITVGGAFDGNAIAVIATVRRVLKEKTKTIVRAFQEDLTTASVVNKSRINLSKVDGYKIRKVSQFTVSGVPVPFGSPIPVGAVEEDITSRFEFNGGQLDSHYDFAYLTLKAGNSAPNSPIRIFYDYFDHSTAGDYFSVDSYEGFPEEIPTYVNSNNQQFDLRNYVDFRPKKSGTSTYATSYIPALGFDFSTDYTYFVPRKDKVYVKSTGQFEVIQGTGSSEPKEPSTPENSMLLYVLNLSAYTRDLTNNNVEITRIDNRRYTMRDIAEIDKRLKNVEYFTALSLIEEQTKNLQLFDEEGNLNFKNGFVVDSFAGQNIADVRSPEFKCAIDPVTQIMRPGFSLENIKLYETAGTAQQRLDKNYQVTGEIATLPYEEVEYIEQPFASRTESVTPFIQLNFIGDVQLTPSTDEWFETRYRPDVVINVEGTFSALQEQFREELGTVWNAWQTTWTGQQVSSQTQFTSQFNFNSVDTFQTTTTTTTNLTGQQRTGERTFIREVFDRRLVDDRIISVDVIPFIRSRTLIFKAEGLKASTRVNAFLDDVSVEQFIIPATLLNFSSKTGTFDTSTAAGSQSNQLARLVADRSQPMAIAVGDVVHNGVGGNLAAATATGIAVIDEETGVRIVNVKGTFSAGQTVYGTISGATGVVQTVVSQNRIITNGFGEAAGVFVIPDPRTSSTRFRAGDRIFTLTDSPTNGEDYTTRALTFYSATGYIQNRVRTIISTRNGELAREVVRDNRTLTSVSSNVNTILISSVFTGGGDGDGGGDPLAQSFLIPDDTGCFVTSFDFYFSAKDRSVPMWFEIREMENGNPTLSVVPGSKVTLKPSQITISNNSSIATRIKLPYPVYLKGGTEYAFVMGSDSPYYAVYISQLGENDILTNQRIAKQPYLGTIFKSQNASTWTADQLQDIKFVINRAKFDISSAANIEFANQDLNSVDLINQPFLTREGSNKVRVFQTNHGFLNGSKVTISGVTGTSLNGIPFAEFNGSHIVSDVDFDTYMITLTTNATSSGRVGNNGVVASKNVRFETTHLMSSQIVFPETSLKHFVQATGTTYAKDNVSTEVIANTSSSFVNEKVVASLENETDFIGSGVKSLSTFAELQSTTDLLSPVLDLQRYSIILVGNRINDTTSKPVNVAGFDEIEIGSSTQISFNGTLERIVANDATSRDLLLQLRVGRFVTTSGAASAQNNGTFLVTEIAEDGSFAVVAGDLLTAAVGPSITLTLNDRFVSEIHPSEGTADAKYIIKKLNLLTPATGLRVFFDVSKRLGSNVDLWYRTVPTGDSVEIETLSWKLAAPTSEIKNTDNANFFNAAEYLISETREFDVAQVKLVMRSTDTARAPIIKQLRMIAVS